MTLVQTACCGILALNTTLASNCLALLEKQIPVKHPGQWLLTPIAKACYGIAPHRKEKIHVGFKLSKKRMH